MDITTWSFARASPESVAGPTDVGLADLEWRSATGPGTAASMLQDCGEWTVGDDNDFDDSDWWFRASLDQVASGPGWLEFDGLATVASAWLDDAIVLDGENMFIGHRVPVYFDHDSDLLVVCRSLRRHLATRRPRPRWKTRLVRDQQLRWVRTTLLGRMPGWSPWPAPVGPWRPVRALSSDSLSVMDWWVNPRVVDGDGIVDVRLVLDGPVGVRAVTVVIGNARVALQRSGDPSEWSGTVTVASPERWYPHTHGKPTLHCAAIEVTDHDGQVTVIEQRPLGFRELDAATWSDEVRLCMNGVEIFARGAIWIPPDTVRMWSNEDALRCALSQMVHAGLNIVRLAGTTVYEQRRFHELCDEYGIMVWQDFMFANMHYPIDDDTLRSSVIAEATEVARRLAGHASTIVLCGGSEVEQQAAMMGVPASATDGHQLGSQLLRQIATDNAPSTLYADNSPSGGSFPFSVGEGVTHYFGVGAYLRPLEEVRYVGLKFASECLAFANVPSRAATDALGAAGGRAPHSPTWKAGVPRDGGTGWDFDDVRDVYCERLFGVDALTVRYADPDRYLDLARATSCFVMEHTVAELRRARTGCGGAIVLQRRDVLPGAGWGIVDVSGDPKAAYYGLRRASLPLALMLFDDGLDGLTVCVHNDSPTDFSGSVQVFAVGVDESVAETSAVAVSVQARSNVELPTARFFETFADLNDAYRFGPRRYAVVVARLFDRDGVTLRSAYFFPGGLERSLVGADVLRAVAHPHADGVELEISTDALAQFVAIELAGFVPDDNWFHLEAGGVRRITCRATDGATRIVRGDVRALNFRHSASIRVDRSVES